MKSERINAQPKSLKAKRSRKQTSDLTDRQKTEPLDAQERCKRIWKKDKKSTLSHGDTEKIHHLQCFRPKEIFNINTHALF